MSYQKPVVGHPGVTTFSTADAMNDPSKEVIRGADGTLFIRDKHGFLVKAAPYLMAAGITGGVAAGFAAGAGGAGASSGGLAAGTVANTAPSIGAAVAPSAAGAASGGGLLGGGMGYWSLASNVGGNLAGSYMQSRSNNKAAQLQANAAREALDYEKQNHAQMTRDYAPYLQAGQQALPALTDFLASHKPQSAVQQPQGAQPQGGQQFGLSSFAPQSMVTLRAPSGEMKQVPQSMAQHYIQLGAQPVGGA
jgi:hypothetical protein